MKVPFVDLKAQYASIKGEIDYAIKSVIEDTAFIHGKYVKEFELAYAREYGVKHCIGVANGTDAIYISLKALGIGQGDEVITVANSWISTSETITQAGARPVFVDIDPDYFTIDVDGIEQKITSRTKAIIPVHLYGQSAEIDRIRRICEARNLHLVEDCAQAHFCTYRPNGSAGGSADGAGQKVGTFGRVGTFSFFPGKNLGAYGDAGAIVTNDDDLAKRARMYANHGSLIKHQHEIEGINSRLDGLQAAILSAKLRHIHDWTKRRQQNALIYNQLLQDVEGIVTPKTRPNGSHVFHLYVVRARNRDGLQKYLKDQGIDTGVHYPAPLPFLKAYQYLRHVPEDFPVAHKYQHEILSLPMYPEITREQIEYVVTHIKNFVGKL